MSTAGKVILSILGILVVLGAVFCGLYFGLPQFHDWVVGLAKPETTESVENGAAAVKMFIKL